MRETSGEQTSLDSWIVFATVETLVELEIDSSCLLDLLKFRHACDPSAKGSAVFWNNLPY